jgi:hypothetical protein
MTIWKTALCMALALALTGCATEAFKAAERSCAADALQAYPVDNVMALVTREHAIEVPTGRVHCTTTSRGADKSTSVCQQVMRTEFIPYQTTELVDRNAGRRNAAIAVCTRDACQRQFGNPQCKSP